MTKNAESDIAEGEEEEGRRGGEKRRGGGRE